MVIGYNQPLPPEMNMVIERGDKIAIVGCNGVGKSTLLKTILGVIPPLEGKVYHGRLFVPAYFEQEAKAPTMTPLEDVWDEFSFMNQHEVRGCACPLRSEKRAYYTARLTSLAAESRRRFVFASS